MVGVTLAVQFLRESAAADGQGQRRHEERAGGPAAAYRDHGPILTRALRGSRDSADDTTAADPMRRPLLERPAVLNHEPS